MQSVPDAKICGVSRKLCGVSMLKIDKYSQCSNSESKNLLKSIFVFLFSFLYVIKQTELNRLSVEFTAGACGLVILIISINDFVEFCRTNKNLVILSAWSVLLAGVIFLEPIFFIKNTAKLILVFNLFLIDKKTNFAASKSMAWGFIAGLVLMLTLISIGVVNEQIIHNDNWDKNKLGFINPNVGSYFLLSIAFSCMFFSNGQRLIPILFLVAIGLCLTKGFYSRTELVAILLIFLLGFIRNDKPLLVNFARISILLLVGSGTFLMLALFGYFDSVGEYLLVINNYSSNRLAHAVKSVFLVNGSGPIIDTNQIDSIVFELFFVMGLPILTLYICNFWKTCDRFTPSAILMGVIILSFVGTFEGVLNKVTALSIGFFHILYNENGIWRPNLFNQSYFYQIWLPFYIARILGVIGIVCIIALYSLPVVEARVYSSYFDTAEDVLTQSKSDDVCNKMRLTKTQNGADQALLIVSNSHASAESCALSIRNLFIKDWLDQSNRATYPDVYITYESLKKDNFFRYTLALILLLGPFVCRRKSLRESYNS